MKFGLRNVRALLRSMRNPERAFRTIHIAGSNGKGSTAAMIASVLSACGYRTGLYTSPHLVSFVERIRIDGVPISEQELSRGVRRIRRGVERTGATFFEAATAIAFDYFRNQRIDIGVIETGLGGRLDATNVLRPMASVITTISREHTQILGNLIGEIAYEKGGIIKAGIPCYTSVDSPTALNVLSKIAEARKARLVSTRKWKMNVMEESLEGSVVDVVRRGGSVLKDLRIGLAGRHQLTNALLALITVEDLTQRGTIQVDEASIRKGLRQVGKRSGLRSRLTLVRKRPDVIADVAHNPAAVSALVDSLLQLGWSNIVGVFGVMKDKEYRRMIDALAPVLAGVIVVQPSTGRSLPGEVAANEFRRRGIPVLFQGTVAEGIRRGIAMTGKRGRILITGSHFVVGEALASLEGKKYLTIDQ